MPTYEYACSSCNHRFEVRQHIRDEALTVCPNCNGPIRRVIQPVGIVFKGGGFYKTDSRNSTEASVPAAERKSETTTTPAKSDSETKSEGTTAPSTIATSTTSESGTSSPSST